MIDRQPLDRQRLELATAHELAPDVQLDDETRSLREGWLTLGRALEQSRSDFDAESLAAQLQAELAAVQPVETARKQVGPSWWPLILGTALALTMLVSAIRSLNDDSGQLPVANHPTASDETSTIARADAAVDDAAFATWSDPLDDELNQAAELVQSLASQPPTIDDSLSGLSEQLQSLASEFENGSL